MQNFTHQKKIHGNTSEIRQLTADICRHYLNGPWKKVTTNDIRFKHIVGGLSNHLYHISLPADMQHSYDDTQSQDPKDVLVRIYGQTHGEDSLKDIITEVVIFTLLSERGLGPKLHGIFPGGRIEEYIQARALLNSELGDENLSIHIAKKMALLHLMEMPLHKEPTWLWNTIDNWLKTCETKFKGNIPKFIKELLNGIDLAEEAKWLKYRMEKENSPVLFCHNDFQEGNILLSLEHDKENNIPENPNLIIIDYEYCSYNYRGFDLANHFVEWIYNYNEPDYPKYKEDLSNYPTIEQRLIFIKAYLNEIGSKESPEKLLREAEMFTLASNFFWTLWSFIMADTSQIEFGYWEYGQSRFKGYMRQKEGLSIREVEI
ncbi:hypothetical protein ABEB36_007589 [Hypothenemus hampei]|uniref:Choline kinase n=1 Tax=Hypothenemus hampei TaxID=57062 RepID=A0ABD1EUI3_HYPHA